MRATTAASKQFPGSKVSAEIVAALAASSMAFRAFDLEYSARLLKRAIMVNERNTRYYISIQRSFNKIDMTLFYG